MDKLYYLVVDKTKMNEMYECLKSFGLNIDVIETHYKFHSVWKDEMIMWCKGEKYPSFVFRSQEDIIKKCGEKVEY